MSVAPLVSIVVNNFNYARFLKEAVGSALAQTWPHTEVIVVDDGSTDESRQVIADFDRRVTSIFKQNGGQASAFNAGFERCRGEIVVFLDADDALLPEAIANAVEPLRDRRVVKVHLPLWEIDAEGNHLGRLHKRKLIAGDYRAELIRRGPVALSQSPTSGNAWARWFLEQVMPLPEHEDKHGADGFLKKLCPIFGEIRRLNEPQGLYRIHQANYGGSSGEEFRIRRGLARYPGYCRLLAQHLRRMGVPFDLTSWVGPKSQYAWLRSFVTSFDELSVAVPGDQTVVLIDNDDLGTSLLPGRRVVSFLEREGTYRGLPADAADAIEELERLRADGARMLVLAFSAFWWRETYPDLFEHLHARYECVLDNERLLVFDLRRPARSARAVAGARETHRLRDGRSVSEMCRAAFGRAPDWIKALGEGSNDCRAFKVRMADRTLKCFECEDAARAQMVRQATDLLERRGIPIPSTIEVIDHVVLAEWVKGHQLRKGKLTYTEMASYQARIHGVQVEGLPSVSNRFLHLEWLLDRLREVGSHHTTARSLESLANLILALVPADLRPAIVQPDFIRQNIVTSGRDLFVVDNEFLSIGVGFEFDILNTSRAVSEGDERKRTRYVAEYEKAGSVGTLKAHAAFWDICYLAKLTGKRFATGDHAMGRVCLDLLHARVQDHARQRGLQ